MKDINQKYLDKGFPDKSSYVRSICLKYGFEEWFILELMKYFKTEKDFRELNEIIKILYEDIDSEENQTFSEIARDVEFMFKI